MILLFSMPLGISQFRCPLFVFFLDKNSEETHQPSDFAVKYQGSLSALICLVCEPLNFLQQTPFFLLVSTPCFPNGPEHRQS